MFSFDGDEKVWKVDDFLFMFLVVSTYKINKSNLRKTKDDGEVEEGEKMLHGKLKMHINLSPSNVGYSRIEGLKLLHFIEMKTNARIWIIFIESSKFKVSC